MLVAYIRVFTPKYSAFCEFLLDHLGRIKAIRATSGRYPGSHHAIWAGQPVSRKVNISFSIISSAMAFISLTSQFAQTNLPLRKSDSPLASQTQNDAGRSVIEPLLSTQISSIEKVSDIAYRSDLPFCKNPPPSWPYPSVSFRAAY